MHGIQTIHKLNREAAEAARIVSSHAPAAPKPTDYTGITKQHLLNAQDNIQKILGGAKG